MKTFLIGQFPLLWYVARNSRNWCTASRMAKSFASNTFMHDPKNHNQSFVFLPLIPQITAPVLSSQFRLNASV
jgi:hypothetical protein